jgi:triosephosphate isomerase
MRRPLIAGNWKMHTTPSEALSWLGDFLTGLERTPHEGVDLLLAVPATHLAALAARAKGSAVALGGQDLSAHDEGAYTGEVSGAMLADAGASHVIVGHSERRAYHHESDELVAAKLRAARRHGLAPILCIGEREEQRDAGRAQEVVLGQLAAALEGVELTDPSDLVIAYEPVWAIGTGRTATADDAQAMSAAIRGALREDRPELAEHLRILYGGSMKPANAGELLRQPDVDGGLIGGASLDVQALLAIVEAAA